MLEAGPQVIRSVLRRSYLKVFPKGGRDFIFRTYARILPRGYRRRITLDGDIKLDVNPGELMGFGLCHNPSYERHERNLFLAAIRSGCTVLDVGANMGVYTLLAAKRGARVFAIEADPDNAKALRHHISLNGLERSVTVFELAISDHEHSVDLLRNPQNCGATVVVTGESIRAVTIDSLSLPAIDLCKMDIEGSEAAALRGMSATLTRSPTMQLLVECNHLSDQSQLMGLLRQAFAHISVAGETELLAGHMPDGDCNLWCWNH